MNKIDIINLFTEDLSNGAGIKVFAYPQSPLTIDNPDILASVNDRLYGIYIPSSVEYVKPQHLLRRILFSRLVYPPELRSVLLVDETSTAILNNKSISISTYCCEVNNGQSISHLIESLNGRLRKNEVLSKAVRFHTINRIFNFQQVFSTLDKHYKEYSVFDLEGGTHLYPQFDWYAERETHPLKNSFTYKESCIHFKSRKSSGLKESLENILTYSLFRNYQLDSHQLHYDMNRDSSADFLNCDFVNLLQNRALANTLFGQGIIPVSLSSFEEFQAVQKIANCRLSQNGKQQ